jgi:hypothetical protein
LFLIENLTQTLKFAGCAGVATGSILVYAYILIYYTKNRGFENDGFKNGVLGLRGVRGLRMRGLRIGGLRIMGILVGEFGSQGFFS